MARDANFPVSLDNYRRKQDLPLHNMGSTLRSDHLSVCRVSARMITLSFMFTLCIKYASRDTSQQVSPCHHLVLDRMREQHLDRSQQIHSQSHYRIVSQSILSRVTYIGKMSNCHHTCFSRWSHHAHKRPAVWDGVGQYTARDLIRFCDECCAIGYFVLLFLVQVQLLTWRRSQTEEMEVAFSQILYTRQEPRWEVITKSGNTSEEQWSDQHTPREDDVTRKSATRCEVVVPTRTVTAMWGRVHGSRGKVSL